jgi:hypothetical protein
MPTFKVCAADRDENRIRLKQSSKKMAKVDVIAFTAVRVILTRNFAGTFEVFQERSDRSCVARLDVFLGSREKSCHIACLQVSFVSLRIHQNE